MIGWKGCQLGESTDSFLHGVQMPVVTDDPAGAHGADVMGGEEEEEGDFISSMRENIGKSVRQIFAVQCRFVAQRKR